MELYGSVTVPETADLVTPAVPTLDGGALVPGAPCQCPTNLAPLIAFGRGCETSAWPCPTGDDGSAFSYYHSSSPDGLDDNELFECEIPEEEWEMEADKDAGAPPAAMYRGDPYETGVFGVAQTALYDESTPYSLRDNYRYEVEWKWQIDLTEWPTTRDWPAGWVYKAAVVWEQRVGDTGSYVSTAHVEYVEITEGSRIWTGELHSTAVSIGDSPGLTSRMFVEIIQGTWPLLPFL